LGAEADELVHQGLVEKKCRKRYLEGENIFARSTKFGNNQEKLDTMQQNKVLRDTYIIHQRSRRTPQDKRLLIASPDLESLRRRRSGAGRWSRRIHNLLGRRRRIRGSAIFFGKDHGIGCARWSHTSIREFFFFFLLFATGNI
jgi:hypothetical protein